IAPTASFGGGSTLQLSEGDATILAFTGAFDPSSADTAAGFRYSFALSPGGLATTPALASSNAEVTLATFDDGEFTIYGRIFDRNGLYSTYQTTVEVTNVAPTATFANDGPVDEGRTAVVYFLDRGDP